jgi:hypothetical protein
MLEERVLDEYRVEVDDATPRRGERDRQAVPRVEAATATATVSPVMVRGEKTLEEVQELHLRDSFWSVS